MEEDHHHYTNMSDLRQLINGGRPPPPHFPTPSLFAASHRNLPFDMMMPGARQAPAADLSLPLHDFVTTTTSTAPAASATVSATTHFCGGLEADAAAAGDGATGRWPRQETLTLLDIRSRLDPKFKEANHKGPLWDEVSRIMCEEHGYQRSGKKCREKFENLYKYYKKTKEGKAGRQDGKHYRFFRQLEALYGDTASISMINPVSFHGQEDISLKGSHKLCDSLSLSNSSEVDTSSEEDDNGESKRRKRGRGWKAKIKDFIDTQMRKLMEKQDAWLEKMMRTMEQKEHERAVREEQWRTEEAARVDRERKLWAKERAWIESRDAALMDILEKIKGREGTFKGSSTEDLNNENGSEIETLNAKGVDQDLGGSGFNNNNNWSEPEITRLIQLRSSLESRLNNSHNNINEELLWEEIGAKMSCYGYERSGSMCKEKWDAINYYLIKKTKEECNKKRKDNSTSYNFHNNNNDHATNSLYNNQGQGGGYSEIINEQVSETARLQPKNEGSSPSSSNAGNVVQDSCFRFLMGDNGDQQHGLWESYGLKLNNGGNQ